MQAARSLAYGGAHGAPVDLSNHGGAHGHGNVNEAAKDAAFSKGLAQKYLNLYPKRLQVPIGTVTCFVLAAALYTLVRPSAPAGKVIITRTKEYAAATPAYLESQRVSVAHKKTG